MRGKKKRERIEMGKGVRKMGVGVVLLAGIVAIIGRLAEEV